MFSVDQYRPVENAAALLASAHGAVIDEFLDSAIAVYDAAMASSFSEDGLGSPQFQAALARMVRAHIAYVFTAKAVQP